MKIQSILVAMALGAVLQVGAHAAPKNHVCPQTIPAASVHVDAPGQAWTPFVSSPLYLYSAALADGPPERIGVLRGSASTRTKTSWTQKYFLSGQYPEGKWLRCDYGAFGEVSLAKRLPDETRECTVIVKKGEHAGENKVEIQCM